MTIQVEYQHEPLILQFMRYGDGLRLWIRDTGDWYPSLGWCPHINTSGFECLDCAMNFE